MRPTPVALGLVRLSTRLLPAGEFRQRYRWELYADLNYLDRPHQLTYASGVLSTAWQLRRELTQEIEPAEEAPIVMNNLKRFTICKLANHKYRKVAYPPTADGEAPGTYLRCQRCGKENHDAGTHARGAGGGLEGGAIGNGTF
jgi:hypothetical protein